MSHNRELTESYLSFENEIPQGSNPNATAGLFIQQDGTLYKKYFIFNELTQKNVDNLLMLSNDPSLINIKELPFPVNIVKKDGRIIGYTMPYYSGRTMLSFVNDGSVSFGTKLSCFTQLAQVILNLPENVFIGDLHLKNVIIDDNRKIHVVDLDGFSVKGSHLLSCPCYDLIKKDRRLQRRKYISEGNVIISRETDILCFYDSFLYFLIGGIYFNMYSSECFSDYLSYLERVSFPKAVIDDVQILFTENANRISLASLKEIDVDKASDYSFRSYSDSLRKKIICSAIDPNYIN